MPCGPICPASDALCIAGFKQASACQPPTRKIMALASSTVFILQLIPMLYCSTAFHIIKNPRNHKHRQFHFVWTGMATKDCCIQFVAFFWCPHLKSWTPRAGALLNHLVRPFSGNWAPISMTRGKLNRPNSGGRDGHTSSFATWPAPPAPARPRAWILDLGFWIWIGLAFVLFGAAPNWAVWIFGFWIWTNHRLEFV